MRRRCRRCRGEHGVALVEFALILPVLMMLILGMFSGGLAYNRKISMTNAVREGARYGATLVDDASDSDDLSSAVRTRIEDFASGDLQLSQICVGLYEVGNATPVDASPASCSFGSPPSDPNPASGCIVKVWAKRSSEIEIMVTKFTVDLETDARARYERDC